MSLAIVVIASEKRRETTFPAVLDSVRAQSPDEIVVVADFPCEAKGVRSFVVEPMLRNTIDALVKRDVGTVATAADNICYLCDDHILAPRFVDTFRNRYESWGCEMLCPNRYTLRPVPVMAPPVEGSWAGGIVAPGNPIWLNVGRDARYIGGHCGIYHRSAIRQLPWSAGPHHRSWDLMHAHRLVAMGASLMYAEKDLAVIDVEPGAQPWL